MKKLLMNLKKRLYLYVFLDFVVALITGYLIDLTSLNIKPVSALAVFIMLYPMLTGMEIEKVKKAGRNFKLIITTLFFAFIIASLTAFIISRTILVGYPDIAFAMIMIGAIPCSNMLIGWTGIADANVEDALVIAVIGLLSIPFLSPIILKISGSVFVSFNLGLLFFILLAYILIPLILGLVTRHIIITRKGRKYFMEVKKTFPGISSIGILLIVFFSVAKVARIVLNQPIIFGLVITGLFTYYFIQTTLSLLTAKALSLKYEEGMILILGATASSQAISLSVAATMFSPLIVFALSFKPMLQVFYIMFLIYSTGPWIKTFLGTTEENQTENEQEPSTPQAPPIRKEEQN